MESEEERLLRELRENSRAIGPHAKQIGKVVRSLMIKRGISDEHAALLTSEQWEKAVGPKLSSHTRPGNIQRGVLYVGVSNNLVLQELHFSKKSILQSIQSALPSFKIKDIRFRIEQT